MITWERWFCWGGLPASGKSSIKEQLENVYGFVGYEVGEYVVDMYEEINTEKNVTEFGDAMVQFVGDHWPAPTIWDDISSSLDPSEERIVISGARVPEFIEYFKENYDGEIRVVMVEASQNVRRDRWEQRNPDYEFRDRDRIEHRWLQPIYDGSLHDQVVETDDISEKEAAKRIISQMES